MLNYLYKGGIMTLRIELPHILENEEDEAVPAWVKRAASVAKTLN